MFKVRSQRPVIGGLGWAEALLKALTATKSKKVADISRQTEFLLTDETNKKFFMILCLMLNNHQK
jgi:hypothetical protein